MSARARVQRSFLVIVAFVAVPSLGFGWGPEGHRVVALVAEKYMTREALAKAGNLLDDSAIDTIASWADDYRRDHRETGPWHYIDVRLADSKIDLARECTNGDCVVVKTEQFRASAERPSADMAKKAQTLKFVIDFASDMHQPSHDEGDVTLAPSSWLSTVSSVGEGQARLRGSLKTCYRYVGHLCDSSKH